MLSNDQMEKKVRKKRFFTLGIGLHFKKIKQICRFTKKKKDLLKKSFKTKKTNF